MNISGTLNVFKLIREPTLCLPQATVSTFNHLPVPLSKAFEGKDGKKVDIRAVILDKDNCFAVPHENEIYGPYKEKFQSLRQTYPGSKMLIVSNTAGTDSDKNFAEANLLENATGVKVFRHSTKKPGCHPQILSHLISCPDSGVTHASQIAIVGDRLFTDVMMANMMGSHAIWVRDGVVGRGFFARMEDRLQSWLVGRGYSTPDPMGGNQFV